MIFIVFIFAVLVIVVLIWIYNAEPKLSPEMVLYDLRKRKGVSIRGALKHQKIVTVSGSRYEQLKILHMPTLVIHGTDDQILPIEHGRKLVEIIPKAKGLWIEGAGHMFPFPNMDKITKTIIAHFPLEKGCNDSAYEKILQ